MQVSKTLPRSTRVITVLCAVGLGIVIGNTSNPVANWFAISAFDWFSKTGTGWLLALRLLGGPVLAAAGLSGLLAWLGGRPLLHQLFAPVHGRNWWWLGLVAVIAGVVRFGLETGADLLGLAGPFDDAQSATLIQWGDPLGFWVMVAQAFCLALVTQLVVGYLWVSPQSGESKPRWHTVWRVLACAAVAGLLSITVHGGAPLRVFVIGAVVELPLLWGFVRTRNVIAITVAGQLLWQVYLGVLYLVSA